MIFFFKEGRRILGRLWEFFLGYLDLQPKLFRVRVCISMSFVFTVSLYDEVSTISGIVIIFH
jgi:hypothetical protein